MCKRNFSKWVHLASWMKTGKVHVHSFAKKTFDRGMRSFCSDLIFDGMLTIEKTDWWEKGSYYLYRTEKFSSHFLERYKDVSKKIRPDFSDEKRDQMLKSFNHLKEII